jgi:cysteine desulfurase family protein (TIGR01976 family)
MIDIKRIRPLFPALERPRVFFDNPGGTQAVQHCLEGFRYYLTTCNANHGGEFITSRESDAMVDEARAAAADLLNASRPEEIVFGLNMTSLTYIISRALVRTFESGDKIAVTRMDHDANISPWVQAAEERGCEVLWVDFDKRSGTLNLDSLQAALDEKPRLLAAGYASNALGTINPIGRIIQMAHAAGVLVYVDAVQFAPHGSIDVRALDCDFLVCSAYKFFGPHLGVLYGRYDLLERIPAFRVRPAPAMPPGKFETGTASFESICAFKGTLDYFQWLGSEFGQKAENAAESPASQRRQLFTQAMGAIQAYEQTIIEAMLNGLLSMPGVHLYGPADMEDLEGRVPTFSFTMEGWTPRAVACRMDDDGINVWNGNFYALAVTQHLGLEESGGLVRVGPVHYNTLEEVERFLDVLGKLQKEKPVE